MRIKIKWYLDGCVNNCCVGSNGGCIRMRVGVWIFKKFYSKVGRWVLWFYFKFWIEGGGLEGVGCI